MGATDLIALGAAVIAICALSWQVYANSRQSRMQTFLSYTQRYQEILITLPIGVESVDFILEEKEEKEREQILRWLRAYFDLCSEEFYLNNNRLVNKEVWNLWQMGMADSLKKPAFIYAWKKIQSNNYYHPEFAAYIDGLIGE